MIPGIAGYTSSLSGDPNVLATTNAGIRSWDTSFDGMGASWGVWIDASSAHLFMSDNGSALIFHYTFDVAGDLLGGMTFVDTYDFSADGLTWAMDIDFAADGKTLMLTDWSTAATDGLVVEFGLTSAWDLSSMSKTTSFTTGAECQASVDCGCFSQDGTKWYLASGETTYGSIFQYNLSSAWDLTSASYSGNTIALSDTPLQGGVVRSMQLNSNGTLMYCHVVGVSGGARDFAMKYTMSTGYDISTLTHTTTSEGIWEGYYATGSYIYNSGKSYLVLNGDYDYMVNEVNIPTSGDSSSIVENAKLSAGHVLSSPVSFLQPLFDISPDGTKLYVSNGDGTPDNFERHDLSTPWDLTTINKTAANTFEWPGGQLSNVRSITIAGDGSFFYALEYNTGIYAYPLATDWDLSTAGTGVLWAPSPPSLEWDHTWGDDGFKLYVSASNVRNIYQYTLSTAWDLTTASYDTKNLDQGVGVDGTYGHEITNDGKRVFVAHPWDNGNATNPYVSSYYTFNLSTAWDMSTATYAGEATRHYQMANRSWGDRAVKISPDGRTVVFHQGSLAGLAWSHLVT